MTQDIFQIQEAARIQREFLLDAASRVIIDHAHNTKTDATDALLTVFLGLGNVLISNGFTAHSLTVGLKAAEMTINDSPKDLQ